MVSPRRVVPQQHCSARAEGERVGLALLSAAVDEEPLPHWLGRARLDPFQLPQCGTAEVAEVRALPDFLHDWVTPGWELGDSATLFGDHRNPRVRVGPDLPGFQTQQTQDPVPAACGGVRCEVLPLKQVSLRSLAAAGSASGASVRHGVAPGNRAGPGGREVRFGSTTVAAPN